MLLVAIEGVPQWTANITVGQDFWLERKVMH